MLALCNISFMLLLLQIVCLLFSMFLSYTILLNIIRPIKKKMQVWKRALPPSTHTSISQLYIFECRKMCFPFEFLILFYLKFTLAITPPVIIIFMLFEQLQMSAFLNQINPLASLLPQQLMILFMQ